MENSIKDFSALMAEMIHDKDLMYNITGMLS